MEIVRDVPLSRSLDRADAFVLESPSTPLLHVVATNEPILLYVNREVYRLVPAARALLARRCDVFAESEAEFFEQHPTWMRSSSSSPHRPPDDAFLEAFLVGRGSSSAASRIVAFLVHAIAEHPLPDGALEAASRGELS